MIERILTLIYMLIYALIGDLLKLFTKKIGYVHELAASNQDMITTRRIGPPIPGLNKNITIVKGVSTKSMFQLIDNGRREEAFKSLTDIIGGETFFTETSTDALAKHSAFRQETVVRNLDTVFQDTISQARKVLRSCDPAVSHNLKSIVSKIALGSLGHSLLGIAILPEETPDVLSNAMHSAATQSLRIPFFSQTYAQNKKALQELQLKIMRENQDMILNSDNYIHKLITEKMQKENKTLDEVIFSADILAKGPTSLLAAETVASLTILVIVELMKHPKILARLQNEIRSFDLDTNMKQPATYRDLSKLTLLQNVFSEGLRYFSPTSIIARYLPDKQKIEEGVVPAGFMFIPVHAIHHNEKYWKNADTFNPDRFNDNVPSQFFLPFSTGKRLCPGQMAANVIFKVIIIEILKNYELQPVLNQKVEVRNDTGSTKLTTPYFAKLVAITNKEQQQSLSINPLRHTAGI